MAFEIRATMLHDPMKQMGAQLFVETMTSTKGRDVGKMIANDMQTLLETAFNAKSQNSSGINLSRLVGYLETMGNVLGSLHAAGVGFYPDTTEDRKPTLRVTLFPDAPASDNLRKPETSADLDNLDGPAFEAALAKLPEAERAKYMNAE